MLCRTLKVNSATPKGGLKTSKVNSATIENREKPREIESDDFQKPIVIEILCLGAWPLGIVGDYSAKLTFGIPSARTSSFETF